jgi:Rab-like protein 5
MYKAKILVLGPTESGKTVISNVLSESTEHFMGEYRPTQGCRILEFEAADIVISGKTVKAEVELWDCSGDHKFESCWPAFAKDSSGVILILNPDDSSHIRDLNSWYTYYIDQQQLKENQCIVFAHNKQGSADSRTPTLPGPLGKLHCVSTSLEEDGEVLKRQFNSYLGRLFAAISERREQDEMNILDSRW